MEKAVHVDEGPIGKTLLAFALPVLVTQLLQELYNAADCAVLGHFGEPGALAATGIAGLLLSVFINFFIGFSSGVSAVTAKLFGAGDIGTLRQTMTFDPDHMIFGEDFRSDLDWEMDEKLSKRKGSFLFNPKILMYHRIHEESATTEIIGDHQRTVEDYEMMKKFWRLNVRKKEDLDII